MYRYPGSNRYRSVMRSHRYQPILVILLLIIAVVVILKLVGVGSLNEGNYEQQRNARLRNEAQSAVTQVNALSRLGATTTSNTLGKIRQYVHGVEVLNNLNVSMLGEVGRLYKQSVFDSIYAIIDQYDANLSTGQKVNETLNTLSEAINALNTFTQQLVGATQTQ
jgi:hypothetical protein